MRTLLFLVAGALAGRVLWTALRPTFARPLFARLNYRDVTVPTGAGVVLPLAVVGVEAVRAVLASAGVGQSLAAERAQMLTVIAALGFGALGLLDDVAGGNDVRGFRGHLGAVARGEVTTGALKLLGGAAVAVIAVAPLEGDRVVRLAVDAALVALAANLGNLFDRAPGRAVKVGVLAFVGTLLAAGDHIGLSSVAVVVGAAVALLGDDLRERLMLGDAGANALGGALGLGVVMVTAPTTRLFVLLGLLALNLASEVISFSEVINRTPPLRVFDRLGRRDAG